MRSGFLQYLSAVGGSRHAAEAAVLPAAATAVQSVCRDQEEVGGARLPGNGLSAGAPNLGPPPAPAAGPGRPPPRRPDPHATRSARPHARLANCTQSAATPGVHKVGNAATALSSAALQPERAPVQLTGHGASARFRGKATAARLANPGTSVAGLPPLPRRPQSDIDWISQSKAAKAVDRRGINHIWSRSCMCPNGKANETCAYEGATVCSECTGYYHLETRFPKETPGYLPMVSIVPDGYPGNEYPRQTGTYARNPPVLNRTGHVILSGGHQGQPGHYPQCYQNECKCTSGPAVDNALCWSHGAYICAQCQTGVPCVNPDQLGITSGVYALGPQEPVLTLRFTAVEAAVQGCLAPCPRDKQPVAESMKEAKPAAAEAKPAATPAAAARAVAVSDEEAKPAAAEAKPAATPAVAAGAVAVPEEEAKPAAAEVNPAVTAATPAAATDAKVPFIGHPWVKREGSVAAAVEANPVAAPAAAAAATVPAAR